MISLQRLEANRRNALRSTGPKTEHGKQRSRANALRHGLTAETVVASLEDAEDYQEFEAAIISDYGGETAVERELVLRLASLLWRLRRATAIEADLLEIQAKALRARRLDGQNRDQGPQGAVGRAFEDAGRTDCCERTAEEYHPDGFKHAATDHTGTIRQLTYCFLRLANLDSGVFERLTRYEAALWRQTVQTLFALQPVRQR